SGLVDDIHDKLSELGPENDGYAHDRIDNNADSHLRSLLLSSSVSVPVEDGDLVLGTWQSVLLFEGDGPRNRTVVVETVGE
ncbi:MAG: secondary thiamine-phosphate synthase enzyme YjbQ, partial [Halobacteria archaeon]|nr:secondary thiamine-phosphate synthase enzyme YjbQ [Halobacteria archaeon]